MASDLLLLNWNTIKTSTSTNIKNIFPSASTLSIADNKLVSCYSVSKAYFEVYGEEFLVDTKYFFSVDSDANFPNRILSGSKFASPSLTSYTFFRLIYTGNTIPQQYLYISFLTQNTVSSPDTVVTGASFNPLTFYYTTDGFSQRAFETTYTYSVDQYPNSSGTYNVRANLPPVYFSDTPNGIIGIHAVSTTGSTAFTIAIGGTGNGKIKVCNSLEPCTIRSSTSTAATTARYFNHLFENAPLFEHPDISTWLRGATYDSMFKNCATISYAPPLPLRTTGSTNVNTASMYENCTDLKEANTFGLGLNIGDSVSLYTFRLQDCKKCFSNCISLKKVSHFFFNFNTSNGLYCNLTNLFENCTSLEVAPIFTSMLGTYAFGQDTYPSSFPFMNMFSGCTSLRKIYCLADNVYRTGTGSYGHGWLNGLENTTATTFVTKGAVSTASTAYGISFTHRATMWETHKANGSIDSILSNFRIRCLGKCYVIVKNIAIPSCFDYFIDDEGVYCLKQWASVQKNNGVTPSFDLTLTLDGRIKEFNFNNIKVTVAGAVSGNVCYPPYLWAIRTDDNSWHGVSSGACFNGPEATSASVVNYSYEFNQHYTQLAMIPISGDSSAWTAATSSLTYSKSCNFSEIISDSCGGGAKIFIGFGGAYESASAFSLDNTEFLNYEDAFLTFSMPNMQLRYGTGESSQWANCTDWNDDSSSSYTSYLTSAQIETMRDNLGDRFRAYKSSNQGSASTSTKVELICFGKNPKFYIYSSAETTYDYLYVSTANVAGNKIPADNTVIATTKGKQNQLIEVNLDTPNWPSEEKSVFVYFRKDSSANTPPDTGWFFIPEGIDVSNP